jgi:predicted ATPase
LLVLSREQGFALWVAIGMILQGWALAEHGQGQAGIAQIRQGLAALRTTGTEMLRPYFLALLAEEYGGAGQAQEGLTVLAEAVGIGHSRQERWYEAELYRLKGELTLQQERSGWRLETRAPSPYASSLLPQVSRTVTQEAEGYFLTAIEIAHKQQAKSWELRATVSLSRLWQQQGKQQEAQTLLAEIYGWFTEGFDTRDLQEAKALLEELT